ncbi:MAG: M15 family metallopeptidase [Candidatus Omnitrophica bacterium]|nr:M15 family metallopeptidase [Candidatus Omnitrophota bacterium]
MNWFNSLKFKALSVFGKKSQPNQNVIASIKSEIEGTLIEVELAKKEAIAAKLDSDISALSALRQAPIKDQRECERKFGKLEIKDGKVVWPNESKYCSILLIPDEVAHGWINTATGKRTTKIYSNKYIHIPLMLALLYIQKRGLLSELKTFDGCFMVRRQRGGYAFSKHSWAVAIDINASENPLGQKPILSPKFVQCFKDAGWIWGGDWTRPDGQHFQYVIEG